VLFLCFDNHIENFARNLIYRAQFIEVADEFTLSPIKLSNRLHPAKRKRKGINHTN